MNFGKKMLVGSAVAVVGLVLSLAPTGPLGATESAPGTATSANVSAVAKMCHELTSLLDPATALADTCPAPTPGSVTNETGTYAGTAYNYVDAYTTDTGAPFQHQRASIMTTSLSACAHFRDNDVVKNETWLSVSQIAWNPDNMTPAPVAPGTYTIGQTVIGSDGVTHYGETATIVLHGKSCNIQQQKDATSGTVTYTQMDDTTAVGHYDLWFGSDHLTGDFTAPFCTLCSARPTHTTCLAS